MLAGLIKIDSIPPEGKEIDYLLEGAELSEILQERALGFEPCGPLTFFGRLFRSERNIFLKGRVQGKIELHCARCLEPFPFPVDAVVRSEWQMVHFPFLGTEGEGPDLEDLETGLISQGGLDLIDRILEEVVLAVPMKPLCRESCPGLCPVCGANLCNFPCTCKSQDPSGPFSVLKNLK